LDCDFETCPETDVTQYAHITYPHYEKCEQGKPLKTEITDIIEALYQYVKKHELFFVEKVDEFVEIEIPNEFPKIGL